MAYEYKVVEVREKLLGGKMSGKRLEEILNEHGAQGWRMIDMTPGDVKGRIGPGATEGMLLTFERQA
ncbi:MAG: DUF4177 domain-containing protein [Ornithinibacter sp.]